MASASAANASNPYASASLYVGDLKSDVTEATLFEVFNAVGPVASIRVCRDSVTRRSLGYAYVNFHSVDDAERALDTMNFSDIKGQPCRIMWSQRDPLLRRSGKGNIFVKNLHESIDNKTLYDTFSVFGDILSCKVVVDKKTGKSRGYGYVHYVDPKSAQKAIKGVDGMKISDRVVSAEPFKPREERQNNSTFTNIYIKYIPKGVTEEQLKTLFETETNGKINSSKFWSHEFGTCACFNFEKSEQAKAAIDKLNGRILEEAKKEYEEEIINNKNKIELQENKDNKLENKQEKEDNNDEEDKEKEKLEKDKLEENDRENNNENNENQNKENKEKEEENKGPKGLYVARCQKQKDRSRILSKQRRKKIIPQRGVNLYVKNLADDIDDDKLKTLFEQFGKITSAKVMVDNGKSRNFGFVCFKTPEYAARALYSMHGQVIQGKSLCVFKAQKKEQRRVFLARKRNQYRQQIFWPYGGSGGPQQGGMGPPQGGMGGPGPRGMNMGGPYGGPSQQGGVGGMMGGGGPQPMASAGPYGFAPSVTNINAMNPNVMNPMNPTQLGNPMSGNQNFINPNLARGNPNMQLNNPYVQQQPQMNPQIAANLQNLNPQQRALYIQQMQAQQNLANLNPNLQQQLQQQQQMQAQQQQQQQRNISGGGGGGPFLGGSSSNNPQNIPQFPNQSNLQRPPPFNTSQQNVALPSQQGYNRQGSSQSVSGISQQGGQQSGQQANIGGGGSGSGAPQGSAAVFQPNVSGSAQNIAPQMTGTAPSGPNTSVQQHSVSAVSGANVHHSASMQETQPLTSAMLQNAKPEERKRFIGERLFPKIQAVEPRRAGKITGMLLEMDDTELLVLLHDNNALFNKINEALAVLKDHQIKQSAQNPSAQNPSAQNASQLNNPKLSASNQQTSQSQTHQV